MLIFKKVKNEMKIKKFNEMYQHGQMNNDKSHTSEEWRESQDITQQINDIRMKLEDEGEDWEKHDDIVDLIQDLKKMEFFYDDIAWDVFSEYDE